MTFDLGILIFIKKPLNCLLTQTSKISKHEISLIFQQHREGIMMHIFVVFFLHVLSVETIVSEKLHSTPFIQTLTTAICKTIIKLRLLQVLTAIKSHQKLPLHNN